MKNTKKSPLPFSTINGIIQDHVYDDTRKDLAKKEIDNIKTLLMDLSKSYEYYSACNKPKDEWDEYNCMMFPIWLRLRKLLDVWNE